MLDTPTFVVAGPGAGKTHGMVADVFGSLGELSPHRFLAAITYTHAATKVIRERLAKQSAIPRNVFIGTTHAFVARFILKPYGSQIEGLPTERIYSPIDIDRPAPAKNAILKNLRKKGVIDYESMLTIASRLMKDKRVRERVGNRLQFLFVDEFQDVTAAQLNIFDELRKAMTTRIRVVGDPEQYISSFTYKGKTQRPDAHALPYSKFRKLAAEETLTTNYRANGELVDFANQFRSDLVQSGDKPHRGTQAVYFFQGTDLEGAVTAFRRRAESIEATSGRNERLYVAFENGCFDAVREKCGIVHVGNDGQRNRSLHADARELLSQALGSSEKGAMERIGVSLLRWRLVAYRLLCLCKENGFGFDDFEGMVKDEFGEKTSSSRKQHLEHCLENLKAAMTAPGPVETSEVSSSIHRAKGLEADAVLAVARTNAELRSFLETDGRKRAADKRDLCRLGYVAATRARELLCFCCLQDLDDETSKVLEQCGVAVAEM